MFKTVLPSTKLVVDLGAINIGASACPVSEVKTGNIMLKIEKQPKYNESQAMDK